MSRITQKLLLTASLLLLCVFNAQALHWHDVIENDSTHVECTLNHSADTPLQNTGLQLNFVRVGSSVYHDLYTTPLYLFTSNQALIRAPPFYISSQG